METAVIAFNSEVTTMITNVMISHTGLNLAREHHLHYDISNARKIFYTASKEDFEGLTLNIAVT